MGRFNMGSTVIMLMPPGALKSLVELDAGDAVNWAEVRRRLKVCTIRQRRCGYLFLRHAASTSL